METGIDVGGGRRGYGLEIKSANISLSGVFLSFQNFPERDAPNARNKGADRYRLRDPLQPVGRGNCGVKGVNASSSTAHSCIH